VFEWVARDATTRIGIDSFQRRWHYSETQLLSPLPQWHGHPFCRSIHCSGVGRSHHRFQNPEDSNAPKLDGSVELTFNTDLPAIAPGLEWSLLIQVTAANVPASRGTKCAKSPSAVASFIGGAEWVRVEHNRIGHISNGGIAVSRNVTAYPSPPSHDTLNWQSQLPMHLTRSKCV
jgi:hypothetical protein